MRSNPSHYEMLAPATLREVLRMLADEPGRFLPIAGGTEIMVALGAGRLAARQLLSIQHLRELRFIEPLQDRLRIGSGTTFADLRRSPIVQQHFPLLERAASWTGSIANQNRATLGGNLVNASPAADSPPALLVYEAEINLVSERGSRTIPYCDFHTSYKKTVLKPEELVHSIELRYHAAGWQGYIRKVGTRNAQAISKIAFAGLARVEQNVIVQARLAGASLRETPSRCLAAEAALTGRSLGEDTFRAAREALNLDISPIDDIRSTAKYRGAVAGNLLQEFLQSLT